MNVLLKNAQMPVLIFDWGGDAVHVIDLKANKGKLPKDKKDKKAFGDVKIYPTLAVLLDTLNTPTILVGESSFESFILEDREAFMERAKLEKHILLTTAPRSTGRHRRSVGFKKKSDKSDFIDVYVIRDLATGNTHLKVPKMYDLNDEFNQSRVAANEELMKLMSKRIYRKSTRAKKGFMMDSAKDKFAKELITKLPLYESLDEVEQMALGNGDEYSKALVACVYIAGKHAKNRQEFERICGFYVHGYPSMIRSEIYMHRWSRNLRPFPGKGKFAGRITLTQFRKAVRRLYHETKQLQS